MAEFNIVEESTVWVLIGAITTSTILPGLLLAVYADYRGIN